MTLDIKTLRLIAYRYAARARVEQQIGTLAFEENLAERRVVISSDGGRVRLREPKRGRKTEKGRRRYRGAWREPKVLIIYVVDAEGKREASFAPVIDATLKGPDAVFALLRTLFATPWDQAVGPGSLDRRWGAMDMESSPVAGKSLRDSGASGV